METNLGTSSDDLEASDEDIRQTSAQLPGRRHRADRAETRYFTLSSPQSPEPGHDREEPGRNSKNLLSVSEDTQKIMEIDRGIMEQK